MNPARAPSSNSVSSYKGAHAVQITEDVLIRRARKGDRNAFETLVRSTARLVYAHLVLLVRHPQHAEDLTQETFLAAWKAIATLTENAGPAGFRSWLLTIARNATIDSARAQNSLKRKRPDGPLGTLDTMIDPAPSPHEQAEHSEQQEQLLALLESLPEDYRQPLMLRYLAGADHDVIRTQLGLTDGALRGLLHRGMALLRERMTHERA